MTQVKLLRVLQERKFRRLGGTEEVDANIRIIAATNRNLAKMVADGEFREDLFYRIHVIPVKLPPLRERQDDVQALAEHFVEKYAVRMKKDVKGISGAAMTSLRSYAWPGNVRELRERDRARGGAGAHAGRAARESARSGAGVVGAPRP